MRSLDTIGAVPFVESPQRLTEDPAFTYNKATDTLTVGTISGNTLRTLKNGSLVSTRGTLNLIEGSNVTLTVTDNSGASRTDVTIAASGGGGGGGTWTEAEIDFGTKPAWSKTFTVVDAGVSASSKIILCPSGNVATGQVGNDLDWDNLLLGGLAGSGSFTLTALAVPGPVVGKRKVFYSVAT